jgi:hypothetical protein
LRAETASLYLPLALLELQLLQVALLLLLQAQGFLTELRSLGGGHRQRTQAEQGGAYFLDTTRAIG